MLKVAVVVLKLVMRKLGGVEVGVPLCVLSIRAFLCLTLASHVLYLTLAYPTLPYLNPQPQLTSLFKSSRLKSPKMMSSTRTRSTRKVTLRCSLRISTSCQELSSRSDPTDREVISRDPVCGERGQVMLGHSSFVLTLILRYLSIFSLLFFVFLIRSCLTHLLPYVSLPITFPFLPNLICPFPSPSFLT